MPTYKIGRSTTQVVYQRFIVTADSPEDACAKIDNDELDVDVEFYDEELTETIDADPAECLKTFEE